MVTFITCQCQTKDDGTMETYFETHTTPVSFYI
jgi:hypothetical protein